MSATFNTQGFDRMVRQLRRYNAGSTRDIVDGITKEILSLTASRTRASSTADINRQIASIFKRPFVVAGQGKVGVTSQGKVWAKLDTWGGGKRWALLNEDGTLRNAPNRSIRTGSDRPGQEVNLGRSNRAAINSMISVAKEFRRRETRYRRNIRGLSKAAWYYIMRQLDFSLPTSAPGYAIALSGNMPARAASALSATKRLLSPQNYQINISNTVQSCLNTHAGGIRHFARSLNGKVRQFETAMRADAVRFAQQFAQRHGFTVS